MPVKYDFAVFNVTFAAISLSVDPQSPDQAKPDTAEAGV